MPERRVGRRESWWRPGCRYRAATGEPQRPDSGDELDRLPERRERALQYGATRVLDPRDTDIANAGLDVSAFVDASGSPHAVMSGIKAVRPAGTAVLVGLGSSEMTLPIEHIQNLEITVTGIFRYTDTWPAAIHLVASGAVDLDSLVTGRFSLDRADEALESDLDPNSLKSIVYPNGYQEGDQEVAVRVRGRC